MEISPSVNSYIICAIILVYKIFILYNCITDVKIHTIILSIRSEY